MSKLNIDKLTEQVQLEKTAEEAQMEKVAAIVQVVDQASTLTSVGEELFKIAEELENENLTALASDIYQAGERMGSALTKMASENSTALEESFEIAEDLNKLASVMAEIADDVNDEDFSKLASAVIDISNEMTEEANELMDSMDSEEGVEKEAGSKTEAVKAFFAKMRGKASAAATVTGEKAKEAGKKVGEHASKVKTWAKENPKKAAGAAAGTVAALGAAGYGAKKLHDKK